MLEGSTPPSVVTELFRRTAENLGISVEQAGSIIRGLRCVTERDCSVTYHMVYSFLRVCMNGVLTRVRQVWRASNCEYKCKFCGLANADSIHHWIRDGIRCPAVVHAEESTGISLDFTNDDDIAQKILLVCAIVKAYSLVPGADTHSHDPTGETISLWYNQFRSVNARVVVAPPEFSQDEYCIYAAGCFLNIAGVEGGRIFLRSPSAYVLSSTFRLPPRVEIWVTFSAACENDSWSACAGVMVLGITPKPILMTIPAVDAYHICDSYTAGHAAMMSSLSEFGSRLATHTPNRQVLLIAPNRRISDAMVGSSKRSPRAAVSQVESHSTERLSDFRKQFPLIDSRVRSAADKRVHWFRSAMEVLKQAEDGVRLNVTIHRPDLIWDSTALNRIDHATR